MMSDNKLLTHMNTEEESNNSTIETEIFPFYRRIEGTDSFRVHSYKIFKK